MRRSFEELEQIVQREKLDVIVHVIPHDIAEVSMFFRIVCRRIFLDPTVNNNLSFAENLLSNVQATLKPFLITYYAQTYGLLLDLPPIQNVKLCFDDLDTYQAQLPVVAPLCFVSRYKAILKEVQEHRLHNGCLGAYPILHLKQALIDVMGGCDIADILRHGQGCFLSIAEMASLGFKEYLISQANNQPLIYEFLRAPEPDHVAMNRVEAALTYLAIDEHLRSLARPA